MDLWTASLVLLWLLVICLAVLLVGALRQLGAIQLRIGPDPGVLITPEGLPRGAKAPAFAAVDVQTQRTVELAAFDGRRLLLVFLSTTCSACADLIPHIEAVARDHRKEVEALIVCRGTVAECQDFAARHKVQQPLLADPTNEIAQRYEVGVTPFTFLIDADGTVLIRGVANSWAHLEALLLEEGTFQTNTWQPVSGEVEAAAVPSAR